VAVISGFLLCVFCLWLLVFSVCWGSDYCFFIEWWCNDYWFGFVCILGVISRYFVFGEGLVTGLQLILLGQWLLVRYCVW